MPLRTTDCRLLFGEEHARESFAICASLRRTAEGGSHGSSVPAVLGTGCTQVLHHCLCSVGTIRKATEAHSPLRPTPRRGFETILGQASGEPRTLGHSSAAHRLAVF